MKTFRKISILIITLSVTNVHALIEEESCWLGMNVQKGLDQEKKWIGSLYSQFRFMKQERPLQSAFVETALGYQLNASSIWLGYRLTKHIYPLPTFQANHLFQQFIYKEELPFFSYTTRSRLEELYRSNQKKIALRFRQRLSLEFSCYFLNKIRPLIYDEVFLGLNKTNYTSRKFINENRLFFGFNFYQQKTVWWEIGYILQYRTNIPISKSRQSHLNHILSITGNIR